MLIPPGPRFFAQQRDQAVGQGMAPAGNVMPAGEYPQFGLVSGGIEGVAEAAVGLQHHMAAIGRRLDIFELAGGQVEARRVRPCRWHFTPQPLGRLALGRPIVGPRQGQRTAEPLRPLEDRAAGGQAATRRAGDQRHARRRPYPPGIKEGQEFVGEEAGLVVIAVHRAFRIELVDQHHVQWRDGPTRGEIGGDLPGRRPDPPEKRVVEDEQRRVRVRARRGIELERHRPAQRLAVE